MRPTEKTFTKSREMVFPRSILVGHEALPRVVDMSRNLGFTGPGLMITGENTYKSAGRDVEDFMSDGGYDMTVCFSGNATFENVDKAVKLGEEAGCRFILAVGGGNKIDTAKLAAKNLGVHFISIPTSASHDGIASGRASLRSSTETMSVEAVSPMGILADTGVITAAPYRYLISGCADVISNISALADWKLSKKNHNEFFSSSAYQMSMMAAETIIDISKSIKPDDEECTWLVLKPIILSGVSMSVAGSSRPTSGSEHMFSHALDALHPGKAMHGEQCGVGSIMMTYLQGKDWMRIRGALKDIGAPVDAAGLGLEPEDIIDALTHMHKVRSDRVTIIGSGLSKAAAEEVARATGVI
ncbi:MAG: NAD(P)-dependent glycerol-1-phosphate dehydrogenase [Thermoplasmatales archaeon]|nr:NAD(P)-dependent glycerol-1-phosphate dehydrogenase [Thermoplasmatales archaeon]